MSNYWFISMRYRHSSKLALFTAVLAFVVIVLGAYTRLTNAGLSCPDWPHCYGYMTAPHTPQQIAQAAQQYPLVPVNIKKAWTEMTHRYAAGTEGMLILILAFSLLMRKAAGAKAIFTALALMSLLCVQVMLGRLTVTAQLEPVIVLGHLLTGVTILALLWWTYLDLHLRDDIFIQSGRSSLTPWLLWIGLFIVMAQIALGGWVSTHQAGLACIDFPYCKGRLLPDLQWEHLNTDLISIHMLHRFGAGITAIYLSFLSLFLLTQRAFRQIGVMILALTALQLMLGVLNIVWLRPLGIALTHQATAILLLLTLIAALVKASCALRGSRYGSNNWLA